MVMGRTKFVFEFEIDGPRNGFKRGSQGPTFGTSRNYASDFHAGNVIKPGGGWICITLHGAMIGSGLVVCPASSAAVLMMCSRPQTKRLLTSYRDKFRRVTGDYLPVPCAYKTTYANSTL